MSQSNNDPKKTERRRDLLRHWKGRIIDVLKPHPEGLTHMAMMLKLGGKTALDSRNLDKSLQQLTFAGIIQCTVSAGRMVYRYAR